MQNYNDSIEALRDNLSRLKPIHERVSILHALKNTIIEYSAEIIKALKIDLGKSEFESYLGEIDFVVHEIDIALANIYKWSKPKRVSSSLTFFPVKSSVISEPFGVVLIVGPWNYPFQLILAPLVGAIAAGNAVVVKPSEISTETSKVINKILSINTFATYIKCFEGGIEETTQILSQKFDYIFYTGNAHVGRIIMEKASKHLTPLTLELGGKSPCLVFSKDRIDISAKRIMWGKYFNVGQTCVAPDYIIIPKELEASFVKSCKKWLKAFYGDNLKNNSDYGKIINLKHFKRLESYLTGQEVILGGERSENDLFFAPTFVKADLNSSLMKEEIFGPILPILTIDDFEDAIKYINKSPKPLACYGFFDSNEYREKLIANVSSGGMVINDTLVHLSNENLPFGGVGESGMGAYHGRYSFDLFSHKKSLMQRSFMFENSLRYPPYKNKLNFIRKLMKFLS